jgi:hypothetical protein
MRLPDLFRSRSLQAEGDSRTRSLSTIDDYAYALSTFGYGGLSYPHGNGAPQLITTQEGMTAEPIHDHFVGLIQGAYKSNGVVFACMLARMLAFSSVRFAYQRINVGKPSELFGDRSLSLLEEPWTGGTTQDLLTRTIQDADLAGNSYWCERGDELVRLRPDWVYIIAARRMVSGLRTGQDGRPVQAPLGWVRLGYVYCEGGIDSGEEPVYLDAGEVAHYAPVPDPEANFRGMSWLTPIIRQVQADTLMTRHQIKFFENAATPNLVIKHDAAASPEKVRRFAQQMAEEHGGVDNAYKDLNLYPGADAHVVGANLEQLDFKITQGGGETRVAAAARVPPIIVGLSEGLQAATYSNYGQARRAFADGTCHPLWGNAAGSFAPLLRPEINRLANGGMVRLWYDARDVPLLREDAKEAAEIGEIQARTIRTYVDGGYTPDSAKRAVLSGDLGLLEHTGLYSVQLREPGAEEEPAAAGAGQPPPAPVGEEE